MPFDAGALAGRLELNTKGWDQSVERVTKDAAGIGNKFKGLGSGAANFGKLLVGIGARAAELSTAVGTVLGAAMISLAKNVSVTGEEIHNLSQKTGIAAEILSGYKLLAEKSGTSVGGLSTGLGNMSRIMNDANQGGKESQAVFNDLGIKYADNAKKLRPLNDVLGDVAELFSKLPDGPRKSALAMQLFSRSGADLIPMLNEGKKGLAENYELTKKLGLLWSGEAAAAAARFNGAMKDMGSVFTGIKNDIGKALLPVLTQLIQNFTEGMTAIRGKIAEFAASKKFQEWVISVGQTFVSGFQIMVKAVEGLLLMIQFTQGAVLKMGSEFIRQFAQWGVTLFGIIDIASKVVPGLTGIKQEIADLVKSLVTVGMEYEKVANQKFEAATDIAVTFEGLNKILNTIRISLGKAGDATEETKKKVGALASTIGNTALPKVGNLNDIIAKAPGYLKSAYYGYASLTDALQALADKANISYVAVVRGVEEMKRQVLFAFTGIMGPVSTIFAGMGPPMKKAAKETKSIWQEVSTVIADAMRDIARSILEVFDIHKLLVGKAKEFDNSYYENMAKQADEAYEVTKALIEGQIDALKIATDKEIDLVKAQYDAMEGAAKKAYDAMREAADRAHDDMMDAAKRAYDANELIYTRAQQDSDRRRSRAERAEDQRYENQYQRERKAIENSTMTEEQKDAALEALEKRYEAAKEAREDAREEARVVRERRREDAKLARQAQYDAVKLIRERHYQDVQQIREINQEKRLEKIRKAGRDAEQALRDAAALKEQKFLTDLLNLQKTHETDKDNLRAAEELARQAHADAEEKRQNSLWTKVKTIFGDTLEAMATIFLTKLFEPVGDLIKKLADKITGKGKKDLGGALDGAGGSVKSLGTTIGDFVGGIGKGIGEFIAGLATGIAKAAHILVGALPDLMLIAAAALAIFAGFTIVKGIVDKIFGGGGGKNTDVTFWLKPISERAQEIRDFLFINFQDKLNFFAEALGNLGQWFLAYKNEQVNALLDKVDGIGENVSIIAKAVTTMADSLKTSTLAAGRGLQAMSPFAWTLSGGAGGQNPYHPGEVGMPYSPGPGVPEPGKPYIRRGWDAPGGGTWGRWGPLTAGAGGTGGFGGSAWQWIKGQDSSTKRSIDAWLKDNFGKNDEAMRRARELLSKGLYDEFLALIGGLDEKIKLAPWNPPDINGPLGPFSKRPITPMDFNGAGATKNEITININALDGADVERITKNKIAPFLERLWERSGKGSLRLIFSGGK